MTRVRAVVLAVCLLSIAELIASDYQQLRSRAVTECQAIDPSAYQSGLLFNPDGYRSYYARSRCFQDAAVQFRDASLCDEVRQRRSLFSSSWGYSESRCRTLVAEGEARDRTALEEVKREYAAGGMRLRDVQIVRNGNGRDIDIIPGVVGTYAHGYTLTFEILPAGAPGAPVLLYSDGHYVDQKSSLHLYVRQSDIGQRFPGFVLNRAYIVRATITLNIGFGGQSGYWSEAFIERVLPARERTHSITRQVVF